MRPAPKKFHAKPVHDGRKKRPLLLGHRGMRGERLIAENTLAAFDFALARGCDGFEFDVRLTGDEAAVVCHDERAGRLRIARRSAAELGLPSLRDVLIRYRHTAFLDIELKVPGAERIIVDLLRRFPPARGFVVSSFLPEVIESLYAVDSALDFGLICETSSQFSRWKALPVGYVILHRALAREKNIAEVKSAGKKIFVWTVNRAAEMKRFAGYGVDGIISDRPGVLSQLSAGTDARKPVIG